MAGDMDCEFEGKLKGVLVSAPEWDCLNKGNANRGKQGCSLLSTEKCKGKCADAGKSRCRLVFAKRCKGKGDINEKPYWIQVVAFEELADQANEMSLGSTVVIECGLNVNRWLDKDGHTVKTSANYIARKVGVVKSLTDPPEWLPGAPRKAKAAKTATVHVEGPEEEEEGNTEVDKFLHGQAAQSAPGGDAKHAAETGSKVQGAGAAVAGVPGG